MTASKLREKVITERAAWVRAMLAGIRGLPLETKADFLADSRTPAAAESYLRRALEALLDLGRHILAKGFGSPASEYKQVATGLESAGVLREQSASTLRQMAGYRNRMVHFYHEVGQDELYQLCTEGIGDVEAVLEDLLTWIRTHPDQIDRSL